MKGGGPDCEGVDDQEAIGELCKRLQNAQESAQKLIDVLEVSWLSCGAGFIWQLGVILIDSSMWNVFSMGRKVS